MSSGLADTSAWIWAGQRLASPIAVSLFTVKDQLADRPIILFASACDNHKYGLVSLDRIGDFLAQHADCSFICENAAQFHWLIHHDAVRLGDTACIQETLWKLSAEYR